MCRAEVIKIEHPTRGDDTRAWGPPWATYTTESGREGPGESAYFLAVSMTEAALLSRSDDAQVNRNKKSIGLSFQSEAGQEILHNLVKECDVLVENYIPGALKKYGGACLIIDRY